MRSLVLLLALGLCAVGVVVATAPAATATCDPTNPDCLVAFLMGEECIDPPPAGGNDELC